MHQLQFSTDVLSRLKADEPRYHERAYLFVLGAIEFLQAQLDVRRHVSGAELAWACRDYAVRQFGLLAPSILEYWGVRSTDDFGQIVFTLVRAGLLVTQPHDRPTDFAGVFEFQAAFAEPYPWEGVEALRV